MQTELDGRNFIDLFGGRSLKNAIGELEPSYFTCSYAFAEEMAKPTVTDQMIKKQFWRLALQASYLGQAERLKISSIFSGLCTYTWFYNGIVKTDRKLAWLLRQPFDWPVELEHLAAIHSKRMIDLIQKTPVASDGTWPKYYWRVMLNTLELFLRLNPR